MKINRLVGREWSLLDSWKDNRRFRCVVVRSIEMDMVVSHFNNNYLTVITSLATCWQTNQARGLKRQRAIVVCGIHTKTVFHQVLLSRKVAMVHRADLWQGHMTFVDENKEVPFREII